jgi:hypothetical protein
MLRALVLKSSFHPFRPLLLVISLFGLLAQEVRSSPPPHVVQAHVGQNFQWNHTLPPGVSGQWFFENQPMPGHTEVNLLLHQVGLHSSGLYQFRRTDLAAPGSVETQFQLRVSDALTLTQSRPTTSSARPIRKLGPGWLSLPHHPSSVVFVDEDLLPLWTVPVPHPFRPAADDHLFIPTLSLDEEDNIYHYAPHYSAEFDKHDHVLTKISSLGQKLWQAEWPRAAGPQNSRIFAHVPGRIFAAHQAPRAALRPASLFLRCFDSASGKTLWSVEHPAPHHSRPNMGSDQDGHVYLAGESQITKFSPTGALLWSAMTDAQIAGLTVDSSGSPVILGLTSNGRLQVRKFSPLGEILWSHQSSYLLDVFLLERIQSGPEDSLWVAFWTGRSTQPRLCLYKLCLDGTLEWITFRNHPGLFGTSFREELLELLIDSRGNCLAATFGLRAAFTQFDNRGAERWHFSIPDLNSMTLEENLLQVVHHDRIDSYELKLLAPLPPSAPWPQLELESAMAPAKIKFPNPDGAPVRLLKNGGHLTDITGEEFIISDVLDGFGYYSLSFEFEGNQVTTPSSPVHLTHLAIAPRWIDRQYVIELEKSRDLRVIIEQSTDLRTWKPGADIPYAARTALHQPTLLRHQFFRFKVERLD